MTKNNDATTRVVRAVTNANSTAYVPSGQPCITPSLHLSGRSAPCPITPKE